MNEKVEGIYPPYPLAAIGIRPGRPKRLVPGDEAAAKALKKRRLTSLYDGTPRGSMILAGA